MNNHDLCHQATMRSLAFADLPSRFAQPSQPKRSFVHHEGRLTRRIYEGGPTCRSHTLVVVKPLSCKWNIFGYGSRRLYHWSKLLVVRYLSQKDNGTVSQVWNIWQFSPPMNIDEPVSQFPVLTLRQGTHSFLWDVHAHGRELSGHIQCQQGPTCPRLDEWFRWPEGFEGEYRWSIGL
jgi:hypothetical protein